MTKKKIKLLLIILIIALIIVVFFTFYLAKKNHKINKTEIINNDKIVSQDVNDLTNENEEEYIKNNNHTEKNAVADPPEIDPWGENNPITENDLKLKNLTDAYSYFLVKQCINQFYSSKDNAYNVLPTELKQYNISNFYGRIEAPSFCIDNIYKSSLRGGKDIYVVYYRLEIGNGQYGDICSIVKIDRKNLTFAIYPFEYLKSKNISSLKENDIIPVDIISLNDIERTEYNHYRVDDITTTEVACIREVFERCRFDYDFDKNHLYTYLNENYKKEKFPNVDDFINYLNASNIFKGSIQKYQVSIAGDKPQYVVFGSYDNYYIINFNNIFNYDLLLDEYTIYAQNYLEVYNSNFPAVQAKYCIERVKKAINDKNYKFVYNKLTSEQRNSTYANYNDFINFIKQCFYNNNTFEYTDAKILLIDKYLYTVKVTDGISYRYLNMIVKLKENADFEINITT